MDFTARIKKARKPVYDDIDTTPLDLPVNGSFGDSTATTIEKILLASGAIDREQWERLKGYEYDIDTDDDGYPNDDSDFAESDDEFSQSRFASYEAAVTGQQEPDPDPVASNSEAEGETIPQVETSETSETKKRGRPKKVKEEVDEEE